jgi:hypothetical protein
MSALEAKAAHRREMNIQAEVEKKIAQLEIDQRVQQADPLLQEKMQNWIKEEVGKAMRAMMIDIMQQIRHSVELETQLYYARRVEDLQTYRLRSPTPVNSDEVIPSSPPLLRRQEGFMVNHIDEECKEDDNIEWDIPEL